MKGSPVNRLETALKTTLCACFVLISGTSAGAQTIFGQGGLIFSPTADTYRLGNFMVSGYFRSLDYSGNRYDIAPIGLVTGVAPRMEVGFGFPSTWGGTPLPGFSDDYAQLSVKYRLLGKPEDPWRLAFAGLVQRGMASVAEESDTEGFSAGVQVISSHNIYRDFHLHLWGGGVLSGSDALKDQGFAGAGLDRFISPSLQFIADAMAATERTSGESFTFQSFAGIRFYILPNLHLTAGGGIGFARDDFDWQYMIGLAFTSDFSEVSMFKGEEDLLLPPPLEVLEESVPPPPSETPGAIPSPEPSPALWEGEVEMASRLFFDFARYRLGENELHALRDLCREIEDLGKEVHLRLIGNADPVGSEKENVAWGIARAINVASRLCSEEVLSPERLLLTSGGEYLPADQRRTSAARQLNRRVIVRTWHNFERARKQSELDGRLWTLPFSSSVDVSLTFQERAAAFDALREIGRLDTNELLLLEAGWEPDSDPWPALRRVAALWLFLVSNTAINPDRIFLHLQPDLRPATEETAAPETSIGMDLLGQEFSEYHRTVRLRMTNKGGEGTVQKGRMVLVADYENLRLTSTGDTLAAGEIPDPLSGRRYRFRKLINPVFDIPVPEEENPIAPLMLYLFDLEGNLQMRLPIFDRRWEERWLDKIARAWEYEDGKPPLRVSLEMRLITLP